MHVWLKIVKSKLNFLKYVEKQKTGSLHTKANRRNTIFPTGLLGGSFLKERQFYAAFYKASPASFSGENILRRELVLRSTFPVPSSLIFLKAIFNSQYQVSLKILFLLPIFQHQNYTNRQMHYKINKTSSSLTILSMIKLFQSIC